MKNFKKRLHYSLYLLLACVLCVGCNKTKEPEFKTIKGYATVINTSKFKDGDTLVVGAGGSIRVKIKPDEKVVGVVIYDTIKITKSGIYEFHSGTTPIFCNKEVEAGQVWVYERDKDNPFETIKRDTMYITDVRGDYVRYDCNGRSKSERISWMKIGSRRIK